MNAFICFFLVKITHPFPKVIMYGSSMGVLQTSLFLTPKPTHVTCLTGRHKCGPTTGIYHSPTAFTKQKTALIATHGHSHRKKKLIMVTGWIYTTVKIGHPTEHMSTK